jgi:hypothetical protein
VKKKPEEFIHRTHRREALATPEAPVPLAAQTPDPFGVFGVFGGQFFRMDELNRNSL